MLALGLKIKLPEGMGKPVWFAHCMTWRYAVWLFERTLVWLDARMRRHQVVSLPEPSEGSWQVAGVGARGDWLVATTLSGSSEWTRKVQILSCGSYPLRMLEVTEGDIWSWSCLDSGGRLVTAQNPIRDVWNVPLGMEIAKRLWLGSKMPLGSLPIRGRTRGKIQVEAFRRKRYAPWILDHHPSQPGLLLVEDDSANMKFFGMFRLQETKHLLERRLGDLPSGGHYTWTRLGSVISLDPYLGVVCNLGIGGTIGTLGPNVALAPWEDHLGHLWCVHDGVLCQYEIRRKVEFAEVSVTSSGQIERGSLYEYDA